MKLPALSAYDGWVDDDPSDPRGYVLMNVDVAQAAAVLAITWPEFVEYRGGVFRKHAFSEANVDSWLSTVDGDVARVEGVVNHLHLWDVFRLTLDEEYAALPAMARCIAATWAAALREQFPGREFETTFADEDEDYGPTISFHAVGRAEPAE